MMTGGPSIAEEARSAHLVLSMVGLTNKETQDQSTAWKLRARPRDSTSRTLNFHRLVTKSIVSPFGFMGGNRVIPWQTTLVVTYHAMGHKDRIIAILPNEAM